MPILTGLNTCTLWEMRGIRKGMAALGNTCHLLRRGDVKRWMVGWWLGACPTELASDVTVEVLWVQRENNNKSRRHRSGHWAIWIICSGDLALFPV